MKRKHWIGTTIATASLLVVGMAGLAGASPLSLVGLGDKVPVGDVLDTDLQQGSPIDAGILDSGSAQGKVHQLVMALQNTASQVRAQGSGDAAASSLDSAAQQLQQRLPTGQLEQGADRLATVLESAAQQLRANAPSGQLAQGAGRLATLLETAAQQLRAHSDLDAGKATQLIGALKAHAAQLQARGEAVKSRVSGLTAQGASRVATVLETAADQVRNRASSGQLSAGQLATVLETAAAQVRERGSIGPAAQGAGQLATVLETAAAQVRERGSGAQLSQGAGQVATVLDSVAQRVRAGGAMDATSVSGIVNELQTSLSRLPVLGGVSLG